MLTPHLALAVLFTPLGPVGSVAPQTPKAAIVTKVHTVVTNTEEGSVEAFSGMVNLAWFEEDGTAQRVTSVPFMGEGDSWGWQFIPESDDA